MDAETLKRRTHGQRNYELSRQSTSRPAQGRAFPAGHWSLIADTQATVDGVVDPVGEWVETDGDHGDYSFEREARSSGLVLGRKTYEGLAGYGRASHRFCDSRAKSPLGPSDHDRSRPASTSFSPSSRRIAP